MAIVEVIKYNGGQDIFAWKYPNEELGTWTQVIVNESQEAVLYKGGQALDLMGPGRHTLETANIPILNKLIKLPFGGRSPFTAEVWYINKVHSLDVKWGTATPIQLQDPKYNVFVPVRAYGQFGIKIENSKMFLQKLVGTLGVFDKDNLLRYFKGLYLTKVKDSISSYVIKKGICILEINAYLDEISEYLKERIIPTMQEYGIEAVNFYVNDISVPEEDPAVEKLKDALAKKAEMNIVGYSYTQERSFDTMEGAARNPGSGQAGIMGAGLGLGMGVGLGGTMGNQFGNIAQNISINDTKKCPGCSSQIGTEYRFCPVCGVDTHSDGKAGQKEVACSHCGHKYERSMKFCPECGDKYYPCTKCGADLKEGTMACPECGNPVPRPCPKCGAVLAGTSKFCPECGASLVRKCAACGIEIEGSPRFCPECGNKL